MRSQRTIVWCEVWDKAFDPHNTLTLLLLMAASVVRWVDKVQRTGRLTNVGCQPMCPSSLSSFHLYRKEFNAAFWWVGFLLHPQACQYKTLTAFCIRMPEAKWIGHILRRNCLLQRVIKGKIKGGIEVTGRRGRRSRKLLDNLKEMRGYFYLKEKALDRTMWRARFGRRFGPVVRQTTK
jgi:hypothetical protein